MNTTTVISIHPDNERSRRRKDYVATETLDDAFAKLAAAGLISGPEQFTINGDKAMVRA